MGDDAVGLRRVRLLGVLLVVLLRLLGVAVGGILLMLLLLEVKRGHAGLLLAGGVGRGDAHLDVGAAVAEGLGVQAGASVEVDDAGC